MNKLDESIGQVSYILENLMLLRDILKTGDCNICNKKNTCEYVPKPGQMVRYNCPWFESFFKIETKEDKKK